MDISAVTSTLSERDANVYTTTPPNMMDASGQEVATEQRVTQTQTGQSQNQGVLTGDKAEQSNKAEQAKGMREPTPEELKKAEEEKKEREEEIREHAKELISKLNLAQIGLQFSMEEEIDTTLINVTDRKTEEKIRQIPSEDVLRLKKSVENISDMQGISIKGDPTSEKGMLLDETA